MKYILSIFVLLLFSCNERSGNQPSEIDTVKLFDPYPNSSETPAGKMNIYERNIVLTQRDFTINFNGQVHKFSYLFRVGEFIKSNQEEIRWKKFYLIKDSNTSFERITSVIDILLENKVTNYKVINLQ